MWSEITDLYFKVMVNIKFDVGDVVSVEFPISTYSILQQSNIIVEDNYETSLTPVEVQVATNTLSVTLVKSIGQETSLELKIDGIDIPGHRWAHRFTWNYN